MKSVLIIAGKLTIGGAERVCRNIGYFADPSSFQVDYLVFGDEIGAYEPELTAKGCRIFHWAPPDSGHLDYYRRLKRLIRENRYDVIHCHTMFNSGIVLRAAKSCGVPVRIAHSHSIRGPEHRNFIKNTYENTMRRWIVRSATHCVGCSRAAGEWLFGAAAFSQKGIVLLNGIDLERYRYDPVTRARIRAELGLDSCFVIGHVGHLAEVKNQIFLLRLMPELLKRQPDAHLLLLGEGSDRPMLEQAIQELGLVCSVTMTGNVSNVNEYLSAMDVFAFPSLYEGMPLSIIEVQANGLPCIISDRVPRDVFLTDLLSPLPLTDGQAQWVKALLQAKRTEPEHYLEILQRSSADIYQMLHTLYQIYEGA